mmetsp:Transcript_15596/g.42516  ORF Transcript_15596/g.42516 Transcript_15596/m.42516 type:complete len:141 (-) Transcript_15596:66-488(-)
MSAPDAPNAFAAPKQPELTKEQAKDALQQTIELMKQPDNMAKMEAAKAAMATQPDNIMMLMMMVMPVATQVCQPVLQKFGFSADQGGLMAYVAATMKHKEDAEIAALGKEMRGTFVPEALEGVIGMMLAGPSGGGMPMGM